MSPEAEKPRDFLLGKERVYLLRTYSLELLGSTARVSLSLQAVVRVAVFRLNDIFSGIIDLFKSKIWTISR
jgi:hypothetical protein